MSEFTPGANPQSEFTVNPAGPDAPAPDPTYDEVKAKVDAGDELTDADVRVLEAGPPENPTPDSSAGTPSEPTGVDPANGTETVPDVSTAAPSSTEPAPPPPGA